MYLGFFHVTHMKHWIVKIEYWIFVDVASLRSLFNADFFNSIRRRRTLNIQSSIENIQSYIRLVRFLHGAAEIHNWQQEEDKSLDKCHKNTHGHDRQGRKKSAGQHEQYRQHQFMTGYIAEKTERKGQNPGQMADDLNGQNNRNQPPNRPQKMLDIFYAVVFDADKMRKQKHGDGTW